jgi:hypothetical protein
MNIVIFSNSGNGGGRKDWDLCNIQLHHALVEADHDVYFLIDNLQSDLIQSRSESEIKFIELTEILRNKRLWISLHELLRWIVSLFDFISLFKNLRFIYSFLVNSLKFSRWLKSQKIDAIVSINYYTEYSFMVCAAKTLEIPAIALQHGNYYFEKNILNDKPHGPVRGQSHEWPCTDVFLFSDDAENVYQKKYANRMERTWVTGFFPNLKKCQASPRRGRQVTIYESANFEFYLELYNELEKKLGAGNVSFRQHPHWLEHECPHSRILPKTVDAPSPLDELPVLGFSIDSSVFFDLVLAGVPVIELKPSEACKYRWQFPFLDWPQAVIFAIAILGDELNQKTLVLEQRNSLDEFMLEDPFVTSARIVKKIEDLAVNLE